jgi:hypothetical protein
VRAGSGVPIRRLGVGAVALKPAVGAHELAVQPVHRRAAGLAPLRENLAPLGRLDPFSAPSGGCTEVPWFGRRLFHDGRPPVPEGTRRSLPRCVPLRVLSAL